MVAVLVSGHRYYKRRSRTRKKHRLGALFFNYLILSQNLVSGVGAELVGGMEHGRDLHAHSSDMEWPGENFVEDISFMVRPESSYLIQQMPSPHENTRESYPEGEPSDSPSSTGGQLRMIYQMTFLFLQDGSVSTGRINWSDYWLMHKDIANLLGCERDRLVATFHVAKPPRDIEEMDAQVILPIRSQEVQHSVGVVYVLVDLELHEHRRHDLVPTRRYATHFPFEATRKQALRTLSVGDYCNVMEDRCIVMINYALWPSQDSGPRKFKSGDYIQCALPPPESAACDSTRALAKELFTGLGNAEQRSEDREEGNEGDDSGFFMQRLQDLTPSSSSYPQTMHVYAFGSDYMEVIVPENEQPSISLVASTWDRDVEDAVDLIEVVEPPINEQRHGEQTFILEKRGDSNYRLFENDQLVLAVVKFHNINTATTMTRRIVLWSRKFMVRFQVFSLLRMEEFCRRKETRECVLAHNNRIWTKDDRSQHWMHSGDSLVLEAFVTDVSLQEVSLCLERIERYERGRRLYSDQTCDGSMPSQGSRLSHMGDERLSVPSRSRSRSRNRHSTGDGGAPGTAEDASRDSEVSGRGSEWVEGHSFLQRFASRISYNRSSQVETFSKLPPPGNPSNEDDRSPTHHLPGRSPVVEISSCSHKKTVETFFIDDEVESEEQVDNIFYQSMNLHPNRYDFVKLLQRWEQTPLHLQIPEHVEIRPVALQFLMTSFAGWSDDIDQLHIYTDGSYNSSVGAASFSFAVFGWNDKVETEKSTFVGWYADVLTTDVESPKFTGASRHSAMDGETAGLIWSHIWLLQSGCVLPVTFHYDSQVSGHGAAGWFQIKEGNTHLHKLRQLVQLVATMRAPTETWYEHVKAHSGSPGNELADGLAKGALTLGPRNDHFPDWKPIFRPDDNNLAWAWWNYKSMACQDDVPQQNHAGCGWRISPLQIGQEAVPNIEVQHSQQGGARLWFKVATYNVMTLRDRQTETGQAGEDWKAVLLREQFEARELHLIGLQETRAGSSGILCTANYVRCIGAGEQGHHGCELWFSRQMAIGTGDAGNIHFDLSTTTVLVDEPRMMAVHLRPAGFSIIVIVAHAPHDGTEQQSKDQWWETFRQRALRFAKAGHLICLGDFNARLGQSIVDCIGERTCEQTTDNGTRLSRILEEAKMWAPTTYSDVHEGIDWTWTHPRGVRARLDYILLGQSERLWAHSSYVDTSIQTSLTVRDHELVVANLEAITGPQSVKTQRRRYDWEGMNTPEGQQKLRGIIESLPEPDWNVDVHVHWQILEDAIHNGLGLHFPPTRRKQRIDLFSQNTRDNLERRKRAKQALEAYDDYIAERNQACAFRAWKDGTKIMETLQLWKWPDLAMEMFRLHGLLAFRTAAKEVRAGVKKDKANYIDKVIGDANAMNGSDIYKVLKPLRIGGFNKSKGIAPLPGFRDGQQPLDNEVTSDEVWLRHCAKMEAGVFTTTGRLLQRARKGSTQRAKEMGAWEQQSLPTLSQLEGAFRRVKRAKAGGNDDLRSDICKIAAAPLARKYHSLLVKIFTQASEPLQMKGGTLIYAHKSGERSNPENYRGLLLSSHIGKSLRRAFRQQLVPCYQQWASDTHFSIKLGGNVCQASHALRLFLGASAKRQQSTGVLFLDIKAAYYRVVRQLTTRRGNQADSIARMMQYFDLGETDQQSLFQKIAERAHAGEEELDRQREILLEEMLSSTWFTSRHRTRVVESLAGSRPGDGLADIVFGLVFHRIMAKVTEKLHELLHISPHVVHGAFDLSTEPDIPPRDAPLPELIDVVWADDLAMAFRCEKAEELPTAMRILAKTVFDESLDHGLTPNLKPGKTEMMLNVRGPGSKKVKAEIFNKNDPMLEVTGSREGFQQIRLITTYKHLGSRVHMALRPMAEIKARFGQAASVYRKYRRQVFQNKLLSLSKRKQIFRSLVMSVLEFNLGTWGPLHKGEANYAEKRLHGFYRGLARATVDEMTLRTWNNTKVRAFVQMPSLHTLLIGARMRYSLSVYNSGPPTLWDLIYAERDWHGQLLEGHLWFKQQLKGYGPDRSGHQWNPNLHEWSAQDSKSLRVWIRKAEQHEILQGVKHSEWREWHYEVLQEMIRGGYNREFPWEMDVLNEQVEPEACLACHRIFGTKAAWSVHAFRVHGVRNKVRRLIAGSRCDACCREYHNPTSLQNHLNHSLACYRRLLYAGYIYDEYVPGKGNTKEIPRNKFGVPPLNSEGPVEERLQGVVDMNHEVHDWQLLDSIFDTLLALEQGTALHECVEAIKQTISRSHNSMGGIRETLNFCVRTMAQDTEEEESNLGWMMPHRMVVMAMKIAAERCYVKWFFQEDEYVKAPDDEKCREAALAFCNAQKRVDSWKQRCYIPRFGAKELVFVHLFSGHRRESDIQMFLEESPAPPGAIYIILSVDVIYDTTSGDLADPTNQARWLDFARRGCLAGVLAGPPCETWSRSRALGGVPAQSSGDGGPRLLRTSACPEGLLNLKIVELQQLILANRLLAFTVHLFVIMLVMKRFMAIEHPACPDGQGDEWLPSIWRLYLLRALAECETAQLVRISQGLFDGLSPKPTTLLVACGNEIDALHFLEQYQTRTTMPPGLQMGYDKSRKEYKTAALKSYPAPLCKGLAGLANQWAHRHAQGFADLTFVPMHKFLEYTAALKRSFNTLVARGADHHRSDAFN